MLTELAVARVLTSHPVNTDGARLPTPASEPLTMLPSVPSVTPGIMSPPELLSGSPSLLSCGLNTSGSSVFLPDSITISSSTSVNPVFLSEPLPVSLLT